MIPAPTGHTPRVCYTEDRAPWARLAKNAFSHFGLEVEHFESNSQAWCDPDKGIEAHPELYDALVVDNDTECWLYGIDLIQKAIKLYRAQGRELIIIVLSSSDPFIFKDEHAQELHRKNLIQLGFKDDTWFLQAQYLKERLIDGDKQNFETWVEGKYGIKMEEGYSGNALGELNNRLYREAFPRVAGEREG